MIKDYLHGKVDSTSFSRFYSCSLSTSPWHSQSFPSQFYDRSHSKYNWNSVIVALTKGLNLAFTALKPVLLNAQLPGV